MNITIRDVNARFWREMKVEAVERGMTMGQAVNLALERWVCGRDKTAKKSESFFDLKPVKLKGEEAKMLSTKVDEVLYR